MCGIYGITRFDGGDIAPRLADRMRDALRHRGPDHAGQYNEPGLVLGMTRLAIVDLATGNQPIFNDDRSLVIVYNGEVYNHLDLRRELQARGHTFRTSCDTETVLRAYEQWGEACLDRFDGMFAFAVWDTRRRSLFLARDRLGVKPLYVAELDDGLAFASEAKALLPLLPDGPRVDWTAIHRYFSFGYVPSPASPFEGIRKLPAGCCGRFDSGSLGVRRYWEPTYGDGSGTAPAKIESELLERLEQAVERELMSDVPVGVFLSGGLDSSAVALFARKHLGDGLKSFALRYSEATHDESADARLVADHLGLEHHEFLYTDEHLHEALDRTADILDEPFGDPTVLPLLTLSEQARRHVPVVLTGWGGDEIFAGYPTYKAHLLGRSYRRLPRLLKHRLIPALVARLPVSDRYMSFEFKAKRFVAGADLSPDLQHFVWMGYFDDAGKRRLLRPKIMEQVAGGTFDQVREVAGRLTERDVLDRIMHLDAAFFLEGNGLFQADRMTMAASLEARVPLLNRDLLDFINPLPSRLKAPRGRLKALLRDALAPHLPRRILNKPKKGFGPPAAAWTRGALADRIDREFSRDRVMERGVFEFDEIERLITEHRRRKADHGRNLWALLSFSMWYDKWILGDDTKDIRAGSCRAGARRAAPGRHAPALTGSVEGRREVNVTT